MVTKDPQGADRDEADRLNLGLGGNRTDVRRSDWFADARAAVPSAVDTHISVLYELGVTKGAERIGQSVTPTHVLATPSTHAYATGLGRLGNPSVVLPQQLSFNDEGTATFSIAGLPDREAHLKQDKSDVNLTVQHYSPAAADTADQPLPLNYDPHGTVNRGQMAAFITRALAHTSVRPAGVSAQLIVYDADNPNHGLSTSDLLVSVRDDDFQPVSNAVVDVFRIDTPGVDLAFRGDGTCREAGRLGGSYSCEIDGTDLITGGSGDAPTVNVGSVDSGGTTIWAWTGEEEDTVTGDSELFRLDIPEHVGRTATQIMVSTDHPGKKAHLGDRVMFTLQIQDIEGEGLPGRHYSPTLMFVDGDGAALALVDDTAQNPAAPADYRPYTVLTGEGEGADDVNSGDFTGVFSTEPSLIGLSEDITIGVKPASRYVAAAARGASSRVSVSVIDQYGDPITGVNVQLMTGRRTENTATPATDDFINEIAGHRFLAVDRDGVHTFGYEREGATADTDQLTATLESWDHDGDGCTSTIATGGTSTACTGDGTGTGAGNVGTFPLERTGTGIIQWTAVASTASNQTGTTLQILAIDKENNTIVVDSGTADSEVAVVSGSNTAIVVSYDDNDRFNFVDESSLDEDGAVSYGRFEQRLSKRTGFTLTWSLAGDGFRATNSFTLNIPASG